MELRDWSGVIDKVISKIEWKDSYRILVFSFEDGDTLQVCSRDGHQFVEMFAGDTDLDNPIQIDSSRLLGKRVHRVLVPYISRETDLDAMIRMDLSDKTSFYISSEILEVPVMIFTSNMIAG